jgi:DNA invertase Pin-like site-specific DNA recombinase
VPGGRFVSYLRVSTKRQGQSGLGVEAQREAVNGYLNGGAWSLIHEVVEVESGKRDSRPKLAEALDLCRIHGATLIIAKLDRLARNVAFLLKIIDSGVDAVFCDLPQLPAGPVGRFMLQQMAAVAELEAGLISARTKAALAAARERGVKLGGRPENLKNVVEGRARGTAATREKANHRAADLRRTIATIQAEGVVSANGIAGALNAHHIPAARGGAWSAVQVQRLLARMDAGMSVTA